MSVLSLASNISNQLKCKASVNFLVDTENLKGQFLLTFFTSHAFSELRIHAEGGTLLYDGLGLN
jgi:hypothetical protein